MSTEIVYIGERTGIEIEYARKHDKRVEYMEPTGDTEP